MNIYPTKMYHEFTTVFNSSLPPSGLVTLTIHNGFHPLSSPLLLELHDSVAKILNATGINEAVQILLREEQETIRGLTSDGSTNIERLLLVF